VDVERENENADDLAAGAERQVLGAHAAQMPVRIDEGGLEVGRLTELNGAAELRRNLPACLRGQRIGEMVAEHLGVRAPGGSFRRCVHVHEPALHVVQARGHHEAVDEPDVDVRQAVRHAAHMFVHAFTMRLSSQL